MIIHARRFDGARHFVQLSPGGRRCLISSFRQTSAVVVHHHQLEVGRYRVDIAVNGPKFHFLDVIHIEIAHTDQVI